MCEYNVKYLRDIRRVRQNTTPYYDVMYHRTDNMFRPLTIRPSSGLTSRAKEEIVKLQNTCIYGMLWLGGKY